jgi:eukaryotic-like serine/threonine-protein kinase
MDDEGASLPMVVGRYAVFDAIASGGMATVHFGQLLGPVGFSRVVAIKRLHPMYARDPEFVSGFLDEARLAARIRHPNVVPTLDVVATKGELFLVMEYVEGESLSRLTKTLREAGHRIPAKIVASIVSGSLQGLHAAHEATDEEGRCLDIIHRDVSPQNILVGRDGMARVLDFGIAKAIGRHQTTRDGQVKGKLSYMAPEQLKSEHMTRQADIYAAGVVLWEALTGARLFKADTEAIVLARILASQIRKPSEIDPALEPFDAVTMKSLAPRPEDRFATAREMALALERCVGTTSTAEVAEWLEQMAGPALRARAASVAAIETGSDTSHSEAVKEHLAAIARNESIPPPAPIPRGPASTRRGLGPATEPLPQAAHKLQTRTLPTEIQAATTPERESTQLSSLSVAVNQVPGLPRSSRRSGALLLGGLATLVGLALVAAAMFRRAPSAPPPPHEATVSAPHAPDPVTAPGTEPGPVLTALPAPPPTTTPTASAAPSSARDSTPRATPASRPRPAPPPATAAPPRNRFESLGGRE